MMIDPPSGSGRLIAVGVDVLTLERLSRALTRSPRLFSRLCASTEGLEHVKAERAGLAWAAALWVSKEASVKCLKTGFWREGVDWPQVVVGATRSFEPERPWASWEAWAEVRLTGGAAHALQEGTLWCRAHRQGEQAWGFACLTRP